MSRRKEQMKCSHCGKKITNGLTICPFCGESTDNDGFDGNEQSPVSEFSDGEFDPEPVQTIPKFKKGRAGKTIPLLTALCAIPAVILAAMLLFFGQGSKEAPLPAFSVPTGHSERIDEGRGILLNELLVIPAEGISRSKLEEILEPIGGAPVAYLAEMNQYQIKFNTSARDELDQKRAGLLDMDEILRADYNLVLSIHGPRETNELPNLPAGKGEKIGVLGDWTPEQAGLKTLYLPSVEYKTEEQMAAAAEQHPALFSQSWKALLHQLTEGRTVTVASAFCYESMEDGSLYAICTSAALRSQLAALVKAGADWIAVPLDGPNRNNDAMLEQETAQMDLLITALEEKNPGFVILTAQNGSDWIPKVLSESGRAEKHSIAVSPSDGQLRENALDLTGTDLPVTVSAMLLDNSDFCVTCEDTGNAAILAAVNLSGDGMTEADRSRQSVLSEVQAGAAAIAADLNGTVRPVFGLNPSGTVAPIPDECKAVLIRILDEVTGLPVPNAYALNASGSQKKQADADGQIWFVTENGRGTVLVKAVGYIDTENLEIAPDLSFVTLAPERRASGTGTIRFDIQDLDGQSPDGLTVVLKDPASGEIRLLKKTRYKDLISVYPGRYDFVVTAYNRTSVTVHDVSVANGEETILAPVSLSIPSDIPGTVSGVIKDAMTGEPMSGVTLRFFEGIGASETDTEIAKITNRSNGQYKTEFPAGEYTMIVSKEGYKTAFMTVHSRGESVIGDQNCTITPTVPEGQVRIVLEWGHIPKDLDSHLFNISQKIHIYFPQRPDNWRKAFRNGKEVANLDVDDTDWEGPETTTILQQLPGQYIFIIHDYTNGHEDSTNYASRDMAASGAKVTVYVGDSNPMIFEVPNQAGIVWEVFTLENGVVTPVNKILNQSEWENLNSHSYERR